MALRTRSWEARSSLTPTNTSLSNLEREAGISVREHSMRVEEARDEGRGRGTGYTPPRPQKGRVQEVWSVGGSDHKHILSAMKPIQLGQELRHHPATKEVKARDPWPLHTAGGASPCRPLHQVPGSVVACAFPCRRPFSSMAHPQLHSPF